MTDPRLVDTAERRIAQRRTVALREGDLPFELGRQPQIVAVEERVKRPGACSMAAWRASAGPPLRGCQISLMRGSLAAWLSTTAAVWSVEQSSAINSSQSANVWAWTEAMVSPISSATFQDGVMIETSGIESLSTRALRFGDRGKQRGRKSIELSGIADIEYARERLPPRRFEIGRVSAG